MSPPEVVSLLNRWSKKLMAEEQEGTPAEELGASYEDQSFVLQARRSRLPCMPMPSVASSVDPWVRYTSVLCWESAFSGARCQAEFSAPLTPRRMGTDSHLGRPLPLSSL